MAVVALLRRWRRENGVVTRRLPRERPRQLGPREEHPRLDPGPRRTSRPSTLSPVDAYVEISRYYPHNRFATYTTAYDGGGGGQTGFYNIMLNDGNPVGALIWWDASCEWNDVMRAQQPDSPTPVRPSTSATTSAPARGTRSTAGHKVYDDMAGGVPTLVDWMNAMLAGTADWQNVECQDCGVTLPGDPMPPVAPDLPVRREREHRLRRAGTGSGLPRARSPGRAGRSMSSAKTTIIDNTLRVNQSSSGICSGGSS